MIQFFVIIPDDGDGITHFPHAIITWDTSRTDRIIRALESYYDVSLEPHQISVTPKADDPKKYDMLVRLDGHDEHFILAEVEIF